MPSRLRVLFLCSGNYYRSRFAEAFFNHHAARQGIAWRAESRGFRLSPKNVGPISAHAVRGLEERGISLEVPHRSPQVANEQDLADSHLVVALKEGEHRPLMRQHFADWVERVEYWRIDDMDFAAPHVALAELEGEIHKLLARLADGAAGPSHADD
jgi:protein-tyrosine phosphatase